MNHIEQQRLRLARSLHDTLQEFIVIIMQLQGIANPADPSDRSMRVNRGLQAAERGLHQSRRLLHEIREISPSPAQQRPTPLFEAVHETLDEVLGHTSVRFALRCPRGMTLPPVVQQEFLGIVREAAMNVVKHADARQVDCQILADDRGMRLELRDDGRGAVSPTASRGYGLRGMKERAAAIGARFEMRSERHVGSTVALTIPGWLQRERIAGRLARRLPAVRDPSEFSHAC